ncbi:MAG: 8-amino-7-oxononanoate synthase, partial [Bacilli bacterium]|nr:8-amino-7-oxononanoate synthase [Bacilli bacterium]
MSNVHELTFLKEKIEQLKADGVYRVLPVNYGPCDGVINLNGKEVINLCSNN